MDIGELATTAYFSKRLTSSQQRITQQTKKKPRSSASGNSLKFPYVGSQLCLCHGSRRSSLLVLSMQETSNMLTRWAITLQSYDVTVEHKPGRLNIVPDTLSYLFNFEHSRVAPCLTRICRNVPDDPALHRPPRLGSYQVNLHNLDKI